MKPLVAALVLVGVATWNAAVAEPPPARPDVTVEAVLPGCRSLVETQGFATSAEAAFCSGLVDALLYLGVLLPPEFCYVVPLEIPHHRVVQAIVEEIDPIYPSVKEQHFRALVLDILEYRWPCRSEPKVR
jgi:hypothetical protein